MMKAIMRDEQEMKDSGIEWIGNIPNSWHIMKISWLFELIGSGTTPKSTRDEYYNGTINWLQSGDINGGYVNFTEKKISKYICDNNTALTIYAPPFIVIAMYGASIGNISIVNIEACTNQACCVLSCPNEIMNLNYLFYQLKSAKDEMLLSSRGGTQPNISQAIIRQMRVAVPSYKEQQYIANYLDDRCSKIDTIIAEAKASIEEYKELKQAIITKAVLNGKRCKRVKDSSIDWIGKYNAEYGLTQISRLCFVTKLAGFEYTNTMCDAISDNGEVPIVRAQNVRKYNFNNDSIDEFISLNVSNSLSRCALDKKAVLITFIGAGIGDVCLFDEQRRYHLAPNVAKIEIYPEYKKILSEEYLMYYLGSEAGQGEIKKISKASAQPSLSMATIRSIKLILPSLKEQQEIVNYLDNKLSLIDDIITEKQTLIADFESYKKSLIYEIVTGKWKVVE